MRTLIMTLTMGLLGALLPMPAIAQGAAVAAPTPVELKVGDLAPDFTLPAATRAGPSAAPVTLSALRGTTVVLAFYPRARTRGCTIQMEHYRDQYDSIFGGGKAATLFAISSDSTSVTAAWAAEAKFPFTFLGDTEMRTARSYGAASATATAAQRVAFVIGPDGRIARIMRPFREIDPTAYTELADAITAVNRIRP